MEGFTWPDTVVCGILTFGVVAVIYIMRRYE